MASQFDPLGINCLFYYNKDDCKSCYFVDTRTMNSSQTCKVLRFSGHNF